MSSQVETYVTVHEQDLVFECLHSTRFADLSVTYLFVGPRPVDKLDGVKVVVAREWSPNYEHYPGFYDFTGWWVLAQPGVVRAEYVICLQDDMRVVAPNLAQRCQRMLEAGPGPVAFTAGHRSAGNWMLGLSGFEQTFNAGMALRGIDLAVFPPFEEWPTTQGTAWRTADLVAFMTWFEPLFDLWGDNVWAGHLAERSVWAWMMARGMPARILPNVIWHEALDRHGTGALMSGNSEVYRQRAATWGI